MAKPQLTKKCCYCNREFGGKIKRSVEHIIPRSKGGTNNLNNLIYCCKECNQFRQNMSFKEFRDLIDGILKNNKVIKFNTYTRYDLQNILNNLTV